MAQSQSSSHAPAHGHPNYVVIYVVLLLLLGVSIALGHIKDHVTMNVLVFGVAAIKAILVFRFFMGAKFESWWLTVTAIACVLCLVACFVGTSSDVTWRYIWPTP